MVMLDPWQFQTEKRYHQMVLVLEFLDVFDMYLLMWCEIEKLLRAIH